MSYGQHNAPSQCGCNTCMRQRAMRHRHPPQPRRRMQPRPARYCDPRREETVVLHHGGVPGHTGQTGRTGDCGHKGDRGPEGPMFQLDCCVQTINGQEHFVISLPTTMGIKKVAFCALDSKGTLCPAGQAPAGDDCP